LSRDEKALVADAQAALANSHAPYSEFRVGAAIRTKSGKVFRGVNVENASLGLSICAERVALFNAVAAGEKEFDAIAIATLAETPTPPCGACRQVMLEFADALDIYLIVAGHPIEAHTLEELAPRPFKSYKS
jgi:cytidine deaminase